MKKLSLVWVFLLCTPLLFAANYEGVFKKWQKVYAEHAAVKWEDHLVTESENAELRKETKIADLTLQHVLGFEVKSAEVIQEMKADLAGIKVKSPYVVIFDKELAGTKLTLVGVKKKKGWTNLYVVLLQEDNGGAAKIVGSISEQSYNEHFKKYMEELEQMLTILSMMK